MEHHKRTHPQRIRRTDPQPLLDEARRVLRTSVDANRLASDAISSLEYAQEALACAADTAPKIVETVRVVSVSSSARPELERLRAACERLGLRFDVLGLGQPWPKTQRPTEF